MGNGELYGQEVHIEFWWGKWGKETTWKT